MSIEVRVPQLPESVADATLVSWHKKAGDAVQRDENLVDLETDKVMLEVPAPGSGVIKEIKVQDGTTVTSGQVLAVLEEGAAAAKEGPKSRPQELGAQSKGAGAAPEAGEAAQGRAQDSDRENGGSARAGTSAQAAQQKLSPSARRIVEEHKLDAGQIPASGRGGHVTKSDVITHIDQKQAAPKPAGARAPARPAGARAEQRVPMTRLRARIAERMVQAQSTQALLTSFNEVDLTEVQVLRARYKERFEKEHGVKLGFSSFFVKACIEALKKFPVVNASVEGNDIVYHEYYDIGVAVSTDRGLMVPVVRDADLLGFADIEKAVGEFARKARDGSIALQDLTGGTFTITNGGVFGSLMSTPIVNPPQSAILGMHKIQERPMVVEGEIAVRPMMYLALTYDHRIIDGREAVQFLVTVKDCLEDPARLMLNI